MDGCIDVRYTGDRGNRAKGFLIECRHALGHSAEHGRRIKGTLALHRLPAAQYACSSCDAAYYLFVQRVTQVGASHRSHLHRRIERIADADRPGCLNKQMLEFVGDLIQQDETFGSQTHLPRVMKAPPDTSLNSLRKIRIFTDDESVRSA